MQSLSDLHRCAIISAAKILDNPVIVGGATSDTKENNLDIDALEASMDKLTTDVVALNSWSSTAASNITTLQTHVVSLSNQVFTITPTLSQPQPVNTDLLLALALNPAARTFVVSNSSSSYSIDNTAFNPDVTVVCGLTFMFDLRNVRQAPFTIRDEDDGMALETGITHIAMDGKVTKGASANVGHTNGFLLWTVPTSGFATPPVYQSTLNSSMVGVIRVKMLP